MTTGELRLASLLPLSAATQTTIRGIDPRIRLNVLNSDARRHLTAPPPGDDPTGAAGREIATLMDQAEVCFSFTWDAARFPLSGGPLRWLQLASAGAEHVLQAPPPEDVAITNVSGLHATPIGEWVLAFFLMHAKQMPLAFAQQQRREWGRYAVTNLRGATVAVVGLGAIGAEVARLSQAFGARVIATKRSAGSGATAEHCDQLYPPTELRAMLAEADYVALCVPFTPQTERLLGAAEFAAMKPTAMLVNIARGAVVEWPAMLDALDTGQIGAVYTDVTVPEPLPQDDPAWGTPNLIITPHNSGNFPDYIDGAAAVWIDNLRRYVADLPLHHIVDRSRGY